MRAVLAACCALLVACASGSPGAPRSAATPSVLPPGWTLDARAGDLVHAESAYRFAASRNGCARGAPRDFDAAGANVAVGYECPGSGLWLTTYLYPTSFGDTPDPLEHFRMVVGGVTTMNPGAEVARAADVPLPIGQRTVAGYHAFVHWATEEGELGSFVVLIPDGARFVKVRATFPLDGSDEPIDAAWQLVLAVLRGL